MPEETPSVWDEALRQGEAVLDRQLQARAEALRAAQSLLRLSVAMLGGIIALGGLVITLDSAGSVALLVGLGAASLPAAAAALCHAMPLVAPFKGPAVVLGADFDIVVNALDRSRPTRDLLVESTVRSLVGWLEANSIAIGRVEAWKARGLVLLALSAFILLGTFVYIQGGRILGQ